MNELRTRSDKKTGIKTVLNANLHHGEIAAQAEAIASGYYSGTSGLLLPVPNKLFYPAEFKEKSRLCFYGSMMNSIEINSSFYKVPMAATVAKWVHDVPGNFKFSFKLSREITHNKGLAFDPEAVEQFMQVIGSAGDKKGCLLVQFPPSVRIAQIRDWMSEGKTVYAYFNNTIGAAVANLFRLRDLVLDNRQDI